MKLLPHGISSNILLIIFRIFSQLISVCQAQMIVEEVFGVDELDCPGENDRTLITAREINVPWGDPWRAFKTIPKGLYIGPSPMPNAGYGLFAETFIQRYTWIGEYEGEVVPINREKDISWYAWTIHRDDDASHFVDARNIATSSSPRWVNCARTEKEQNVLVQECRGKIYYIIIKNVYPGQELLVYYGDEYAASLDIPQREE